MTRGIPFPRFKQLGVTYWASSPTPFNSSLNFFLFLLLKIYLPVGSGWRFWWLRWTVGRQRRGHKAEDMASKEEASRSEGEEYVYRISTAEEWESLQKDGAIFGGDLDKSSGFIHLSKLNQVPSISLRSSLLLLLFVLRQLLRIGYFLLRNYSPPVSLFMTAEYEKFDFSQYAIGHFVIGLLFEDDVVR